jgi:hypothetical protein
MTNSESEILRSALGSSVAHVFGRTPDVRSESTALSLGETMSRYRSSHQPEQDGWGGCAGCKAAPGRRLMVICGKSALLGYQPAQR